MLTVLPSSSAPYVKVYLVDGKRCLSKAKTTTARRTLDPFYQQTLVFTEKYAGCVLQVRVPLKVERDRHSRYTGCPGSDR